MKYYGTSKCIVCGEDAVIHCGHVIVSRETKLDNQIDSHVLAGFCSEEHKYSIPATALGCYGEYKEKHGLKDIFNIERENDNEESIEHFNGYCHDRLTEEEKAGIDINMENYYIGVDLGKGKDMTGVWLGL